MRASNVQYYQINKSIIKGGDERFKYFKDISFVIIQNAKYNICEYSIQRLTKAVFSLYKSWNWKLSCQDIITSLQQSYSIILALDNNRIIGTFSIRDCTSSFINEFYYLEKLVIDKSSSIELIILISILLIKNLIELKRDEIILTGITSQRLMSDLFSIFNEEKLFISNRDWQSLSFLQKIKVNEAIKVCIPTYESPGEFILNDKGYIFNRYNDRFSPPNASCFQSGRLKKSALFLMTTIPDSLKKIYENYRNNSGLRSTFLELAMKKAYNNELFVKKNEYPNISFSKMLACRE